MTSEMTRSVACIFTLYVYLIFPGKTTATHSLDGVGNIPTITTQAQDVIVFEVDADGNPENLMLPCPVDNPSPTTQYRWFRNNMSVSSEMVDSAGTLIVPNITLGMYANREGVTYYCIASDTVGMNNYTAAVRSRDIKVFYAYFDGFGGGKFNGTVPVALNSDVALECDVLGAKPAPQIKWYRETAQNPRVEIMESITNDATFALFLENRRYLYLRNIGASHLSSQYYCEVVNAEKFKTVRSNTSYTLEDTLTLGQFVRYKEIGNDLVGFVGDMNYRVSFVGGGHDTTRNTTANLYSVNRTEIFAQFNLGSIEELTQTGRYDIFVDLRYPTVPATATGTLNVDERPRITNYNANERELLVGEGPLPYECNYTGTPTPTIRWFFNGETISSDSGVSTTNNTLTIASPQVSHSGIYQCIVSNEHGDDQLAWLVEIREPIRTMPMPYNFTELNAFDDRDLGALFVRPNGTIVNFFVNVVADPCPTVVWRFNDTVLTSNSTFTFNNPCLAPGARSPNWRFTLDVLLSEATSGAYNADFTNITGTVALPKAYFTIPAPVSVNGLQLSESCLKENTVVSLRCLVSGFPRPTLEFTLDGVPIIPGQENIDMPFYDEISITVPSLSDVPDDQRTPTYGCREAGTTDLVPETYTLCSIPQITSVNATSNPEIGSSFFIECTAAGFPMPTITWMKDGMELSDTTDMNLRIISTRLGSTRVEVAVADSKFNGRYMCVVENLAGMANRTILIDLGGGPNLLLPIEAVIGIAAAAAVLLLIIVVVILLLVCVYMCAKSTQKRSAKFVAPYIGSSYTDYDPRGNVDKDSDEEDAGQPEAFNPQYESLPAHTTRPSQPPLYKPAPSYPGSVPDVDDMEMVKIPPPDTDSYLGQAPPYDNGAPYNRPSADDFLSEDAQFV